MIFGIYGKTGSGKSTVCEYLSKKGFYVIDCDKLGHNILKYNEEGYKKTLEAFGEEFLLPDKNIDRKKLGKFLFENKDKLEILNSISFPLIEKEVYNEIEKNKDKNIIIDGAHIYKTNIINICDAVIQVKTEKSIERITKRDNISEKDAKNRLNSQEDYEICDYVVYNNGTLAELYICIDKILKKEEGKRA